MVKAQEPGARSPVQLGWGGGAGALEAKQERWRLPRSGAKLT